MKFLIITGYAPSLINFRYDLLKRLVKENYKITAISKINKYDYKIKEKLHSIGINFLPIYITHKISNPILEVISIFHIGIRIIQIRPDKAVSRVLAYHALSQSTRVGYHVRCKLIWAYQVLF